MDFKISKELVNDLMNYFSARPWAEANPYLLALSKLTKLEAPVAPAPAPAAPPAPEAK